MAILSVGPTSLFSTIAAAMAVAVPGDVVVLENGYSNETATVTQTGLTVNGATTSSGIVLQLATGDTVFTATGAAPVAIVDSSDGNGIVGNAGDNVITVTGGADAVDGGPGIDRLIVDYHLAIGAVTGDSIANFTEAGGGRLVTITSGTFENFTVLTGAGADTITTGAGDDVIDAGAGANTITAGQGANRVTGGNNADTIVALDGGNFIDGGNGTNDLAAGGGEDTILSGTGDDTIVAGAGADLITVRGGVDTVDAGAGQDQLIVDYSATTTNVSGGVTGGNLATGYVGHIANLAGDVVDFQGTENFIVTCGSGNDLITSGDGADVLIGGAGDDSLNSSGGSDRLTGGAGNDALDGGPGIDTVVYFGQRGDYTIADNGFGILTVADTRPGSPDGTDELTSIENLSFANSPPTGSVTISGTLTQGQVLTASGTLADPDGLGVLTYQWRAFGVDIAGAVNPTFTLGQAQVGKTITVAASYTDLQGTPESAVSAPTAAVANVNDPPTGSVTISGTLTQGQVLTASDTLADPDGLGVLTYQWRAFGVDIAGAVNPTFTLGQAQVGKTITVAASYTDLQGTPESAVSAPTGIVAPDATAPAEPAALALTAASDSGVPGDLITNVNRPTIIGTGEENATVTLRNGNTTIGTAVVVAGFWSIMSTAPLSDGPNSFTANQTDLAGNVSVASVALNVTIDTAAPTAAATVSALSADTGIPDDFVTQTAAQTVSGTFTGVLESSESVQVSANGGATWVTATTSNGTFSAAGVTLATGNGTLSVRTVDEAGNIAAGTPQAYTLDAAASAMGDVHMVTFDGLHYDFQATGAFVLTRSMLPGNTFEIQIVTASAPFIDAVSITTVAGARVGSDVVTFGVDRPDTVWINGLPDTALSANGAVQMLGGGQLEELSATQFRLTWSTGESLSIVNVGGYLDCAVTLGPNDGPESVRGLLGPNSGTANAFQLPDGTVLGPLSEAEIEGNFATAWQVTAANSMLGDVPIRFVSLDAGLTVIQATAAGQVLSAGPGVGALSDVGGFGTTFLGRLADLENEVLMGFTAKDVIDIANLAAATTQASYTAFSGGGVLHLSDGTLSGDIQIFGQAPLRDVRVTPDANGGALVQFG